MNINHAILHVFDFVSGSLTLSQRELDVQDKVTRSFVQRLLRKVTASPDSRQGAFTPESGFAGELEGYLEDVTDFTSFSQQIARFLYEELKAGEDVEQFDLLVADYEDEPKMKTNIKVNVAETFEGGDAADYADAVDAAMQQAMANAYESKGERMFALVLLARKPSFSHGFGTVAGSGVYTCIQKHDNGLPNPTQKIDSYAVVNTQTYAVECSDKVRTIAGKQVLVLPDALLQCTTHASSREVVQQVTSLVSSVAEEYGSDSAAVAAISRAKAYIAENAAVAASFSPDELGKAVFEDEPAMRQRYESRAREESLPERVEVRKAVATRMASNHKIRTDTGIEITFPSEYTANTDFIAFSRQADGSISIEIRGIGKIENR